jgi:hypothetical protein
MRVAGKHRHVGTDLGDDHLRHATTDTGDCDQQLNDRRGERVHDVTDPVVGRRDRRVEMVDVIQVQPQQHRVVLPGSGRATPAPSRGS